MTELSKAKDLVFYANRSTPQVVSPGASAKPKKGYGAQTKRRRATADEEKKMRGGKWLRVDQSGKKGGEDGYKKTKYRPGLVGKAITPGGRVGDDSPVGTPGGRQNWVDRRGGLPTYIREVAHAMMRKGKDESSAIRMAVGIIRNWAEGKGKGVSAAVKAAAVKTMAQWEAMKASSGGVAKFDGDPALTDLILVEHLISKHGVGIVHKGCACDATDVEPKKKTKVLRGKKKVKK